MQLQLAENVIPSQVADNYTFVPGVDGSPGVWVRDDSFDHLPDEEYQLVMAMLDPYQPKTMSELAFGGRRKERRAQKKEKRDLKNEMRKARIEKKRARGEFIKMKGEGKREGSWAGGDGAEDTKEIIGTVGSAIGNIFGGGGGGAEAPIEAETPFYKNPMVLIGGAVVIGTLIFVATRKK